VDTFMNAQPAFRSNAVAVQQSQRYKTA